MFLRIKNTILYRENQKDDIVSSVFDVKTTQLPLLSVA